MARKSKKQVVNEIVLPVRAEPPAPPIANGLGEAIGFGGTGGLFGGGAGFPGGGSFQQVEDSTTLFENLRWYLVSNFRQLLSQLFVEIGLVQTICMVPVQDGLRGGVMFKSKQLSEDEIKKLQNELDRNDDLSTAGWAATWNRLYGGAGILIMVEDQDPELPLNLTAIDKNTLVEFRAVDMWELFFDKQSTEGYDPTLQEQEFECYDYYAEAVHRSRVMRMKGIQAPSFVRPRLRGWGVSVVEALVRSMNQYLKATDLGFEVLDEFKVDVYKIKNMVNTLLQPNGTKSVKERIAMANWQKNFQNAIVMDSEDDFDHKQVSFAGLAEAMQGIRMQVAADMRMPIIKLFGQSVSSGLGNSAQDEMENYNSMVESEVRGKLKYHILQMAQIRCQQLFGSIPDDLELEFKPLRELTAIDQENVKTQKFTRVLQAKQAGMLSDIEYRDASNKGNLFDIQLDTTEAALAQADEDGLDDAEGEDTGKADQPNSETPKANKNSGDKFDESKHPRADDGKFGKGGGGKDKGKKSEGGVSTSNKPQDNSPEEIHALKEYGVNAVYQITRVLRGNDELSEGGKQKYLDYIKHIDSVMKRSKTTTDKKVFRGMSNAPEIAALGESAIGSEMSVPNFWSTTEDEKVADSFSAGKNAVKFEIDLPAGSNAIDLEDYKPKQKNYSEKELLLPRDQKYKVVGFRKDKDGTAVYSLEVLK